MARALGKGLAGSLVAVARCGALAATLLLMPPSATIVAQPLPAVPKPAPTEAELAARGAKRLLAAEFETLYIGNTLSGMTSDGEPFHVFVESGTAYRMLFQGKRSSDAWNVNKEGEFCTVAGTEITCTREHWVEQTVYSFNPDGSFAGLARIRTGNPEKL